MFYMHDIGWAWWLLGWGGMILMWALLVYAAVLLVRGQPRERARRRLGFGGTDRDPSPPLSEPPEQILSRRLAAGEITVDEYHELHAACTAQAHERR